MHTAREVTAYDIRRDAEYALQWMDARLSGPDAPGRPGQVAAAEAFVRWCCDANEELLKNPAPTVEEIRKAWRLTAVASGFEFMPYQAVYALGCVVLGTVAIAAYAIRDSWTGVVCGGPKESTLALIHRSIAGGWGVGVRKVPSELG